MNCPKRTFYVVLIGTLFCSSSSAQLPSADLSRIEPHVGKVGQDLELSLFGKYLDEVSELRFTHPGIQAIPLVEPASEFYPARPLKNRFSVKIAPNVPPGTYEVRSVGYYGISTARPFVVAPIDSVEVQESGDHQIREAAMPVEVNSIVNGVIAAREIDWFRFKAQANQTVTVEVIAERIDSRLDSELILYDQFGNEIDRNRDTLGRDSLLHFTAADEGEYYLSLSDILFRGGSEHFYRLRIHDQPYVDFIFPPAAEADSSRHHTLHGVNLPGSVAEIEIQAPTQIGVPGDFFPGWPRRGVMPAFKHEISRTSELRIGFATAPVVVEDRTQTQVVQFPCEIAGRFDEPGDEDRFRFHAQAGTSYAIEAISDRMGIEADPLLIVHHVEQDERGNERLRQIAENDDLPTFFSVDGKDSVNADTNDAALTFTADQTGVYQVTIANQLGDGAADKLYRLAIRNPLPIFSSSRPPKDRLQPTEPDIP